MNRDTSSLASAMFYLTSNSFHIVTKTEKTNTSYKTFIWPQWFTAAWCDSFCIMKNLQDNSNTRSVVHVFCPVLLSLGHCVADLSGSRKTAEVVNYISKEGNEHKGTTLYKTHTLLQPTKPFQFLIFDRGLENAKFNKRFFCCNWIRSIITLTKCPRQTFRSAIESMCICQNFTYTSCCFLPRAL